MKHSLLLAGCVAAGLVALQAQTPDNLVVEGVPPLSPELKADVGRYLEFRSASLRSWHPQRREMIIGTRFAEANQLHLLTQPGGARKQITFLPEPVGGGSLQPTTGEFLIFSQDAGGGEFYQFYRFDLADARITLLTDGKSRNSGGAWSTSGRQMAYTSTRRTGRDNDVWLMDPTNPATDRLVLELSGGGWGVLDWSPDDSKLLLGEYVSINESYLWLVDLKSGSKELLTPRTAEKIAWGPATFAKDGRSLILVTDQGTEFKQLYRMNLATKALTPLGPRFPGDIEEFDLSDDGKLLAVVTNEEGASRLHVLNAANGKEVRTPKLPLGVMGGLSWHKNNRDLGFTLTSAQSPSDVYSLDVKSGKVERWTDSETGGLDPRSFVEPELVRVKSFDGVEFSAFVYRPDPKKFPGPRPVLLNIHGGPEAQSRPIFQARNNYLLNELGVAVIYPNVRGSDGYGKTFLTLDNGFKREDSVKDIGALLDWVATQPGFNRDCVAVIGGSYGGYMVLACMIHYADRLRCGVDIVGISNFLTFLKNTQDYRRDLRRVEYGDEREPAMAEFLERVSPTTNARKITKPLFVVQGLNDPRVPVTEAEQMVKAIRDQGGKVWYLMAKDEGHGFAKKRNSDFMFFSVVQFLQENLLK
jgi:dipeptidyl aminopeptidase/acylaminoacyl peptidase